MKKAFTIVELISVIIILALLMIVVLPSINSLFGDTKEHTRESKIKEIETASYNFAYMSKDDIKILGCVTYSIDELIKRGIIMSEDKKDDLVIDPVTNEKFDGFICTCYNNLDNDLLVKYLNNDQVCNINNLKEK